MVACPICQGEFSANTVSGVTLASCDTCDGLWLAQGDLDRLAGRPVETELHESARSPCECRYCQSHLGLGDDCPSCGRNPTIQCPRGHGVMHVNLFQMGEHEFEVDGCPSCRGLWIDGHERPHMEASTSGRRARRIAAPYRAISRARRSSALDRLENHPFLFPDPRPPLVGKDLHLAFLVALLNDTEYLERPGTSQPLLIPIALIVLAVAGLAVYFYVLPLLQFLN